MFRSGRVGDGWARRKESGEKRIERGKKKRKESKYDVMNRPRKAI